MIVILMVCFHILNKIQKELLIFKLLCLHFLARSDIDFQIQEDELGIKLDFTRSHVSKYNFYIDN